MSDPMAEPEYLISHPGKLAKRPGLLDELNQREVTPEDIATYRLDHCGHCRDAEFYGAAWGHGNPHERHVPVIEDGLGPLAGQPCACRCAPVATDTTGEPR